jgi:hypothetical protein
MAAPRVARRSARQRGWYFKPDAHMTASGIKSREPAAGFRQVLWVPYAALQKLLTLAAHRNLQLFQRPYDDQPFSATISCRQ